MKLIVTGVAGFLGSNLLEHLLKKNYYVLGIDNLSTGKIENIKPFLENKNFEFYEFDLTNKLNLNNLNQFDGVIHLAALADIRYNLENFEECMHKNINLTNNIIECVVKNNISKILFASTCSVYGNSNKYPTKENEIFDQTSVYSATKIASEKLLEGFANTFQFNAFAMRFVSMIGPKYSHGHIYDFMKKILNKEKELHIINNGESLKSYLHVNDAVEAIIKLLNHESENYFEAYNISHSEAITLKYSIDTIVECTQYKGDIVFGKNISGWTGDNTVIIPSIEKINKLGWYPKHSIKQGIKDTIEYLIQIKNQIV
jgi:UDP-glucose 4-epimerase